MEKTIDNFVNTLELSDNTEKYTLIYLNKSYYIKKFLYDFFLIAKKKNFNTAINKLKTNNNLSDIEFESLKKSINNVIEEIVNSEESKKYINYSIVLFSKNLVNHFSNKLTWLFHKKIFITLILMSISVSVYIFFFYPLNVKISNVSILETVASYIIIFTILILHEFGHASSSAYYKIKPEEIGFGFYLIFPVLFANVTKIWKLKRNQRIVVNLAGIYFQLIINILLFIFFILIGSKSSYILSIMKINILVVLYSLIPFIRNDGYWIYSDYFDIQNLNQKSNTFFYQLFKRIIRKDKTVNFSLALIIYSSGNYAFLGYIMYKFILKFPETINEIIYIFNENGAKSILTNHFGLIIKLLIFVFLSSIIYKSIISWFKEILKSR